MGKIFNPKIHHRKSIRLREYDYTNPNWYYVTVCTYKRENIFGKVEKDKMVLNEYGKIVEECWKAIPNHFEHVSLDYFVIMPNHIHGIIIIERRDTACCVPTMEDRKFREMNPGSLSVIVRSFKSAVTKGTNELRKDKSAPIWQKNYYEHIIRNEMDLFYIRRYIELNPLKWELDEYYSS